MSTFQLDEEFELNFAKQLKLLDLKKNQDQLKQQTSDMKCHPHHQFNSQRKFHFNHSSLYSHGSCSNQSQVRSKYRKNSYGAAPMAFATDYLEGNKSQCLQLSSPPQSMSLPVDRDSSKQRACVETSSYKRFSSNNVRDPNYLKKSSNYDVFYDYASPIFQPMPKPSKNASGIHSFPENSCNWLLGREVSMEEFKKAEIAQKQRLVATAAYFEDMDLEMQKKILSHVPIRPRDCGDIHEYIFNLSTFEIQWIKRYESTLNKSPRVPLYLRKSSLNS